MNLSRSCNRCGKCCANILLLSDSEIIKIKDYIVKNNITVINRNNVTCKEDFNICPFLDDKNKKCNIYDVRPSICRSFNCNHNLSKTMDYDGVKAINMLFTFGGDKQFSVKAPDLTFINNRIKELQEQIKRGNKI